ncbi:MAG: NAD(P)-binding domain-containing protein [Saprospiraceae bacterium]|nr:NAD(P)-binding domain-containing protein [Saprospiraceae bacterium]MBK9722787.1 NAD(P)-binding domain-containing protein [Saprospiraceae bacterium]
MNIAVLGTGTVGETIGSKLIELGHTIKMGSRTNTNEKGLAWVQKNGSQASLGTFAEAATFAEVIFNCTKGVEAVGILKSIDPNALQNKILIDLTNPLDFSNGMPPSLSICNTNSLGEEIQQNFPELKVVKTLNTMWCGLMVNPSLIGDEAHVNFICGNDEDAKSWVKELLRSFGWKNNQLIDLDDISAARGTEMYLPLWLRIYGATKNGAFNIKIIS